MTLTAGGCCWAEGLPKDILMLILDRLFSLSDYIRFSAVCKSWLSTALDQKQSRHLKSCQKQQQQLPLLMIPTKDNSPTERSLYGIIGDGGEHGGGGKYYNFRLRVPYNKRCCGSSYGWLATVEKNFEVSLLNPFSGETHLLPPIAVEEEQEQEQELYSDVHDYTIHKVIFSANPSSSFGNEDFTIVAIFGSFSSLAFIRPGRSEGGCWTLLRKQLPRRLRKLGAMCDVIFYKEDQLYVVNQMGDVFSVDCTYPLKSKKVVPKPPKPQERSYFVNDSYLVESFGGELLLVNRCTDKKDHRFQMVTVAFKVFKMVRDSENDGQSHWVEIKCLPDGDSALFLGDNHSMCVSTFMFPGCQPNCIYYTDDDISFLNNKPHGARDMGVFNLEDGSIGTHYKLDPSQKHMPPAIWIVPTIL